MRAGQDAAPGPALALGTLGAALALALGGAGEAHAEGRTGVQIFSQKCAACHAGGGNVVNGKKTLQSDALQKYGYDDLDKAIEIISKGSLSLSLSLSVFEIISKGTAGHHRAAACARRALAFGSLCVCVCVCV